MWCVDSWQHTNTAKHKTTSTFFLFFLYIYIKKKGETKRSGYCVAIPGSASLTVTVKGAMPCKCHLRDSSVAS